MKIEYRYYVARRTDDGLLKIAHEAQLRDKVGSYNTVVLISIFGYETRPRAMEAVEAYIKGYRARFGYGPSYTFMILEEMTMSEDEE